MHYGKWGPGRRIGSLELHRQRQMKTQACQLLDAVLFSSHCSEKPKLLPPQALPLRLQVQPRWGGGVGLLWELKASVNPSESWVSGCHLCLKFHLQLWGTLVLSVKGDSGTPYIHSASRSRKTQLCVPSLGHPQSQLIPKKIGSKYVFFLPFLSSSVNDRNGIPSIFSSLRQDSWVSCSQQHPLCLEGYLVH